VAVGSLVWLLAGLVWLLAGLVWLLAGLAGRPDLGSGPPHLDTDRDQRQQDDHRDHRQQVRVDAGNGGAQRVAGQRDADRPQQPADHLPAGKRTGGHAERAGQRVEHGAHDRDEAGQHDGLAVAIAGQQPFGPLGSGAQVLVAAAPEQGLATGPPDVEASLRAEQRTARRGQQDERQSGLGEQHQEHAEGTEAGQQRGGAQRVERAHELWASLGQHWIASFPGCPLAGRQCRCPTRAGRSRTGLCCSLTTLGAS
jgi:hypothetical protein